MDGLEGVEIIRLPAEDHYILGVLDLQRRNHGSSLPNEVCLEQGFVSSTHSMEFLKLIAPKAPTIIAVDRNHGDKVVGYTISLPFSLRAETVQLNPFLDTFFQYCEDNILKSNEMFVMGGQICVDKDFRGKSLAVHMLKKQNELLAKENYDCCVTEIALSNQRSIRAHEKAGYFEYSRYTGEGIRPGVLETWCVVGCRCK